MPKLLISFCVTAIVAGINADIAPIVAITKRASPDKMGKILIIK